MNIARYIRNIVAGGRPRFQFLQSLVATGFTGTCVTLTDAAAVPIDCSLGNCFELTCANNNARVFGAPTNMLAGDRLALTIINTSGGALNATTFAAGIKQPAITYPATGFRREYLITSNGTNISLVSFSAADVPN